MAIRHPFQKLCCVPATLQHQTLLFAASGPSIFTFQLQSGKSTSRWSTTEGSERSSSRPIPNPNKRVKLDHEQNATLSRQESEESIEISVERRKGERRKPKVEHPNVSNVSHILATSDGQTLIAVTNDDKTVHVLEIRGEYGVLMPESARSMPKRICAIVLDADEKTILVGDKFGDVYSMPLHPAEDYIRPSASSAKFEPSATELTVHTKGNLDALRQQREQKKINPRKEGPDFEHKLLLGHVSLLTDVLIARVDALGKRRTYILTSDRDEHIRISRFPQAHIIEGYCLGHRDFVSRLCIPEWRPDLLISGGGEPSLKVFDWQQGRLLSQDLLEGDLRSTVQRVINMSKEERAFDKLAISGIWAISPKVSGSNSAKEKDGLILLALEGMPLLISFTLDVHGKLCHQQTVKVSGNILDVTHAKDEDLLIISLDSAHLVGSTKVMNMDEERENEMLTAFDLVGWDSEKSELRPSTVAEALNSSIKELEGMAQVPKVQSTANKSQRSKGAYSMLGEFLYGLENLRKRRGQAADDLDGDAEGDEALEASGEE